jgi:hypothetical protein
MDWVVSQRLYVYHRVGYDRRILELRADQTIGRGAAALERTWHIEHLPGTAPVLCINSSNYLTCRLQRDEHDVFRGHWLRFERMPIELIPIALIEQETYVQLEIDALRQTLEGRSFVAVEVQHTHYSLALDSNERLRRDDRDDGRWRVIQGERQAVIVLWPDEERQVHLDADADGVWRGVMTCSGRDFHLVPIPSWSHTT